MRLLPDIFARQAGLSFRDLGLLCRALTHRSFINENPDALEDNERLEFLGDAVLDSVSGAWLYHQFPEMNEGQLTRLRSALVRTEQLAEFAREIHLGDALRLGRGEAGSGGRDRPALLCDGFEALIGALFLDQGIEAVAEFMRPRLTKAASSVLSGVGLVDPRSLLQIWAQAELGETPRYRTVDSYGPDHARVFIVEVYVGDKMHGRGQGGSKQEAAQNAAAAALSNLGSQVPVDGGL